MILPSSSRPARKHAIQTTLFELVEAVGDSMEPHESLLVPKVVSQLIFDGKMKFLRIDGKSVGS